MNLKLKKDKSSESFDFWDVECPSLIICNWGTWVLDAFILKMPFARVSPESPQNT